MRIVSLICGVVLIAEIRYPKGERLWARYYDKKNALRFFITSKEARDYYFLYEVSGDSVKKLGKARTPRDLEMKYKIEERMGGP